MTADALLVMLDGVKTTRRGWLARCPAHPDRHPSLSVRDGDRAILVRCWSGCSAAEIVAALGLSLKDLFFDAGADPSEWRVARGRRVAARVQRQKIDFVSGLQIDAVREAEALIRSACGLDISRWSPERLDRAMNALADARSLLEKEDPPCR